MAEQTKRRRHFGPLTYGALVLSALSFASIMWLYLLIEPNVVCCNLLRKLHETSGLDRAQLQIQFRDAVDPGTSYWLDCALEDLDPEVREFAMCLIDKAFPDPARATTRLIKRIKDRSIPIRLVAIDMISAKIRGDKKRIDPKTKTKAIAAIESLLSDPDLGVRFSAFRRFDEFSDEKAKVNYYLRKLSCDVSPKSRIASISILKSKSDGDSAYVDLIESSISDPNSEVRSAAAGAICDLKIEGSRKIYNIQRYLFHRDDEKLRSDIRIVDFYTVNDRKIITTLIENLGEKTTNDLLIESLNDRDPRFLIKILNYIGVVGDLSRGDFRLGIVIPLSIRNGIPIKRLNERRAIPDIFSRGRIEAIAKNLNDEEGVVRLATAEVLLKYLYNADVVNLEEVDQKIRQIIFDHKNYNTELRAHACSLFMNQSIFWSREIEEMLLNDLNPNNDDDSDIVATALSSISKLMAYTERATPTILKLIERFPEHRSLAIDVLKHTDPHAVTRLSNRKVIRSDSFASGAARRRALDSR